MNTADYLLASGQDQDLALISGKEKCTYFELRQASARMAAKLTGAGVEPGERVAILGSNSLFWVASYLAAMKLGAVAVPFATTLTSEEAGVMAGFAGCRRMCIDRRLYPRFAPQLGQDFTFFFDDELSTAAAEEWPPAAGFGDLNAVAALMFTSGTTARPRAVQVTHRNLQANTNSIIEYLDLDARDRMMDILPFYYCFGASLLHTHLRAGGSLVMATSFVYPEMVLDQMEREGCTGIAGVPSNYQTLLRNSSFPRRKMKSLRKVQQAGGKLQDVLIRELIGAVPQAKVFVMYGQTEATARLSYLDPGLLDTRLGSVGKGIPGVTLKVIGESGEQVRPGEVGEIYAWGENISPGYFNDPEATAQKFVGGALHTGDLAVVDKDGYIFVVDRKADFIKSCGFRVSSQQIEACIIELPEVVAAAVIGEPDLVRGEAILAFVVIKDGSTLNAEQVITHCARRLASHMVPRDVVFIDKLPLNANGKVVKTELRKRIGAVEG